MPDESSECAIQKRANNKDGNEQLSDWGRHMRKDYIVLAGETNGVAIISA